MWCTWGAGAPLPGANFSPPAPVMLCAHGRVVCFIGRDGGVLQHANCSPYISFSLCSFLSPASEHALGVVVVVLLLCCRFIPHQGAYNYIAIPHAEGPAPYSYTYQTLFRAGAREVLGTRLPSPLLTVLMRNDPAA